VDERDEVLAELAQLTTATGMTGHQSERIFHCVLRQLILINCGFCLLTDKTSRILRDLSDAHQRTHESCKTRLGGHINGLQSSVEFELADFSFREVVFADLGDVLRHIDQIEFCVQLTKGNGIELSLEDVVDDFRIEILCLRCYV